MKFSIAIYASPTTPELALSALSFAEGAIARGHEIYRLFFFSDGVLNGVALPDLKPADAGEALCKRWQDLIGEHHLDAVVCVSSAKKRGVFAQDSVAQDSVGRDEGASNCLRVADGFTIGGLGQLIDATVNSDRVITFGN